MTSNRAKERAASQVRLLTCTHSAVWDARRLQWLHQGAPQPCRGLGSWPFQRLARGAPRWPQEWESGKAKKEVAGTRRVYHRFYISNCCVDITAHFHPPSPKSQRSHLVISQPVRPKSLALLTQGCYVKTKWTRQPYASKPVPWNFKKKKNLSISEFLDIYRPWITLAHLLWQYSNSGSQNVSRIYG